MSETQEGYGAQSTPDMGESYPLQSGEMLSEYLASLSARVNALEAASREQSAYQRSMETRIEELESKFEDMDANENTMFELLNEVLDHVDHWFNNDVEQRVVAFEARIERLEAMMSDPEHEPICRDCGQPEHMDGCDAQPEPTEEPTVTTPTVTRERTHGRYGTRNLTKSKPDHIVDANKKVCATCGHDETDHLILLGHNAQFLLCEGGTLGKSCGCTGYKRK